MRLLKENKTTDLRVLQAHQEVGGTTCTFKYLADHARRIQEDQAAKGGDMAGQIDGKIH